MKKNLFFVIMIFAICANVFSQTNATIDIDDEIYPVLKNAEMRGLCSTLSGIKPYTRKRILKAIDEILENEEKLSPSEIDFLENYKAKNQFEEGSTYHRGFVRVENSVFSQPLSFQLNFGMETYGSAGIYTNSDFNSFGFDIIPSLDFTGDLGRWISYRLYFFLDVTSMPLEELGTYFIGYAWYDDGVEEFLDGDTKDDGSQYDEPKRRIINKYQLNSYLPYSYRKKWDGQVYLFSNLSASGLEGWATEAGIAGGLNGEINFSALDDKLEVRIGRVAREWAGMDNGASLVFNANARPFVGAEFYIELFKFLKYAGLTGSLEYPNQDYITNNAFRRFFDARPDDAYFFQNGFSINMIELDFEHIHFDFGSSVIWPKRFELGYMFPLTNYVVFQNNIGDYDNLGLFGDIKLRKKGLGSVWASLYLDESGNPGNNPFTDARVMYAAQFGTKLVFPWLPFGTVSLRYTKVEPYCYTHQSINYTPWYSHYISENYTNNGSCLGYYLDPNSDELLLKIDFKPKSTWTFGFQYQFIRHGADYGSQQVPGSSLYSELPYRNRDELEKYFLHDGAYNWMHIVSVSNNIHVNAKFPFDIIANAGILYSYYTMIDDDNYDRSVYGNYGNCKNADTHTEYYFVDNDEYPVRFGGAITLGIKFSCR